MKRLVRHCIWFYRCYRALMAGRYVYYVPDLKVMCFADSIEQCRGKFMRHRVVRPYRVMQVCYILFGYMSNAYDGRQGVMP